MTLDLEAIKTRAGAATPGPWHPDPDECCVYADEETSGTGDALAERILTVADASFIAAARSDVPALVAEVERLTRLLEADVEWHLQFDVAVTTYKAAWPDPAAAIPTINAINALVNAYDEMESKP